MVGRILSLLNREVKGLHEAAYLLGVFAILSQMLALVRDRLLAHHFGASATLDIYYAAFRLPDFIFVSIASLFSLYVLIPFLSEASRQTIPEQRAFLGRIISFFLTAIVAISIAVFIAAPALLRFLFPGFADAAPFADLVFLTRILLLQPILLGLSNIAASITQTRGRFMLYAISPLFYNAGIILGILWFYPIFGLAGLGYGVVLGALMHLAVQMPFIMREGYLPSLTRAWRFVELKRVLLLSLPRTLALSANQIALLVLTSLASFMTPGAIATFNFSFNLQAVPLSIIGISYSVAAFPTLARLFSNGQRKDYVTQVQTAARHIIFWSLPATVLFIVLRAQIVRVVLGSGEFSWADTRITAAALALFSVSLVAQALVMLFVRGYYAAGDTRTPLLINIFSSTLVIAFAFGFLHLFNTSALWRYFMESLLRVEDLPRASMLMLPLGYTLASFINLGLFMALFHYQFERFSKWFTRPLFESLSASVIMGFVSYEFLDILGRLFDINTFLGIFAQGFFAGMFGIAASISILWLLGNVEIREVWRSIRHKFWQTRTITPETPDSSTLIS